MIIPLVLVIAIIIFFLGFCVGVSDENSLKNNNIPFLPPSFRDTSEYNILTRKIENLEYEQRWMRESIRQYKIEFNHHFCSHADFLKCYKCDTDAKNKLEKIEKIIKLT